MKHYDKLIFELSRPGRTGYSLPKADFPQYDINDLPETLRREEEVCLPEVDEPTVVRHYTNLSLGNFGVDTGFYPLGSCTMKYNPKINEEVAALPAFAALHPAQPADTVQGALEVAHRTAAYLAELTGMSAFTLNPYAGAHGELTGLMVVRSYHESRGEGRQRRKVLIPDSAHGTNPASAAVCGLEVVQVPSLPDGMVDVEALKGLVGSDVAGMMMTNPNTLGLFEHRIPEIAALVHGCGGLMYYDGANFNAILGRCRPGDMLFDVMHINLHKTFSTPHGGGGPGSGPVGVRGGLEAFLPAPIVAQQADGTFALQSAPMAVSGFLGNFGIVLRAYAYLLSIGRDNWKLVSALAVLNANYVKEQLKDYYDLPLGGLCKHEFVFDGLREEYGGEKHSPDRVTTLHVAKRLLDYGFHAPTIYFPLLFHEALMIEPTETESRETLDAFIDAMKQIAREAQASPEQVRTAPHTTPVGRLDDVLAAKEPHLTFAEPSL